LKLQVPFIQLPLAFDAARLAAEVAAIEEAAWMPHPQGMPGNSMLPLIAVNGDPADEAFAGPMQPTPLLRRCPYLMQVMASFGAVLGRSRLMRLSGHAEVKRHADLGYYWRERVRVHVPIVTQPTVRFDCGDASINMRAGECWIFDTWRQHRVINDAVQSRIHLVADTIGGVDFWDLVARGRPDGTALPDWQPRQVGPDGGSPPTLAYEAVNVPEVMTPWEMGKHLEFLLGEALPHPQLPVLRQHVQRLLTRWHELWAIHGERPDGRGYFRGAFNEFSTQVKEPATGVLLQNQTGWIQAVLVMLGKIVVAAGATPGAQEQRAMGLNA
jgi:hypothetical protein